MKEFLHAPGRLALPICGAWGETNKPLNKINATIYLEGFPGGSVVKKSACQCRRLGSIPGRKTPWRSKWQPTPVFLSGEFHGQRSLVGYSPCIELDAHTHTYLNIYTFIET